MSPLEGYVFGLAEAFNTMVSATQIEADRFACHTFVKAHGPDGPDATELIPEKALRDTSLHEFDAKDKDLVNRAAMLRVVWTILKLNLASTLVKACVYVGARGFHVANKLVVRTLRTCGKEAVATNRFWSQPLWASKWMPRLKGRGHTTQHYLRHPPTCL